LLLIFSIGNVRKQLKNAPASKSILQIMLRDATSQTDIQHIISSTEFMRTIETVKLEVPNFELILTNANGLQLFP